jgi:hypothetical protein
VDGLLEVVVIKTVGLSVGEFCCCAELAPLLIMRSKVAVHVPVRAVARIARHLGPSMLFMALSFQAAVEGGLSEFFLGRVSARAGWNATAVLETLQSCVKYFVLNCSVHCT